MLRKYFFYSAFFLLAATFGGWAQNPDQKEEWNKGNIFMKFVRQITMKMVNG